jgi:hypothetical protein
MGQILRKIYLIPSLGAILLGACGVKGRPLVPDLPPPIGTGISQSLESESLVPPTSIKESAPIQPTGLPKPTNTPDASKGSKKR